MTDLRADNDGFVVVFERRRDRRIAVRVIGELDIATVPRLRARLQALHTAQAAVVLDLSRTTFLDSTGVQLLLVLARDAARDRWDFTVCRSLARPVRDVLALVDVEDRLPYRDC